MLVCAPLADAEGCFGWKEGTVMDDDQSGHWRTVALTICVARTFTGNTLASP